MSPRLQLDGGPTFPRVTAAAPARSSGAAASDITPSRAFWGRLKAARFSPLRPNSPRPTDGRSDKTSSRPSKNRPAFAWAAKNRINKRAHWLRYQQVGQGKGSCKAAVVASHVDDSEPVLVKHERQLQLRGANGCPFVVVRNR